MPSGERYTIQESQSSRGHYAQGAKLLDAVPSTLADESDVYVGPWVDVSTLKDASIQVVASGLTGTVNIEGCNLDNPVAGSVAFAAADTLTASGVKMLTVKPIRYVRARMTGFTAGSVSVALHGVS